MAFWVRPPQLVLLEDVLTRASEAPLSVSDDELIRYVQATYWGTNCWSWVEMSLAIISAVCAMRSHLAERLLADPIEAMIAGGLDDENEVIAQGLALARKESPYVPLTEGGRAWLLQVLPSLEGEVKVIFRRKQAELAAD